MLTRLVSRASVEVTVQHSNVKVSQLRRTLSGMRVLAVVRLSRETDETTSPERQRRGLEAWATSLGHEIVGWVEDLDVSGDTSPWERPELGLWLGDSPPAHFDIIAGTKIDRLSRNLLHFVQLINWAGKHGKHVAAYMDSVDTSTETGELVAKVLAIFAEFERKAIARRNAESREEARNLGNWHGGNVAYGYRPVKTPNGKGWKIQPDPDAKAVIAEIVSRVLAGETVTAVAADLTGRGVPSPMDYAEKRDGQTSQDDEETEARESRPWHYTVIRRMLTSRTILGQAEHNGEVLRHTDGKHAGEPIQRAEPLISATDFEAIKAKLSDATRRKTRTSDGGLLSGLSLCGEHEVALHHQHSVRGDKHYRYYRCPERRNSRSRCESAPVNAVELDGLIEDGFLLLVGDLEVMEKRLVPGEDHTAALERVERNLRELEEDRMAGIYSTAYGRESYQRMSRELFRKQEELSALPQVPDRWEDVPTGQTFGQLWDELETTMERRRFLAAVGVEVKVYAKPNPVRRLFPVEGPLLYGEGPSRFVMQIPPYLRKRVEDHTAKALRSR
jgi:site-specific DNA recombinase